MLLYYKVSKEGVVTIYQSWLWGKREHKKNRIWCVLSRGVERAKAQEYNLDDELKGRDYQPLVTILKEVWVPTEEQHDLL
jgi:hypothetical protein